MIKLLWYSYFAVYLAFKSLNSFKILYLRKFNPEQADDFAYKKLREMCHHLLKRSKTKLEAYGLENIPKGPSVFIGNHQAIFDGFAIVPFVEKGGFIAKKEISKIPLVGWWLKQTHTVYIDRSNVKEGIKAINEGVENVKKGYSMIIFPEGTRSLKSSMGEFKKGSLKLALKAGAPIVPFTVDGTYKVLEVGNKVQGNTIKIKFHPPINVLEMSKEEQKDVTDIVYNVVKEGLEDFISKNNGRAK